MLMGHHAPPPRRTHHTHRRDVDLVARGESDIEILVQYIPSYFCYTKKVQFLREG